MIFSPSNDPFVQAMADRVRAVISRQPGHRLEDVAASLGLQEDRLRHLIEGREPMIDTPFLIEAVAALVRESGVDPKWLLCGEYDGAMHRRALLLGEDRSTAGVRKLRDLVYDEYKRMRLGDRFLSLPRAVMETARRLVR